LASTSFAHAQAEPTEPFEDRAALLVIGEQASALACNLRDDWRVWTVEQAKDRRHGLTDGVVDEGACIETEKVGTGVFVRYALAAAVDRVAPIVFVEVVLEAMEYAGEILEFATVAVRDELEQRIQG
jgi:hypothetical protein